jgi:hypothetical protein
MKQMRASTCRNDAAGAFFIGAMLGLGFSERSTGVTRLRVPGVTHYFGYFHNLGILLRRSGLKLRIV